MIFASEPYVLHLLAGTDSTSALDAVKQLLDNGTHNVNEREPQDNLSPLHVAAAWDNLAMCQLLMHYGADVKALDIDNRQPIDVATGKCRKFLKKYKQKKQKDQNKLIKMLSCLFGQNCTFGQDNEVLNISLFKIANKKQRSCPSLSLNTAESVLSSTQINNFKNEINTKLEKKNLLLTENCVENDDVLTIDSYKTADSLDYDEKITNEQNDNLNKMFLNKNLSINASKKHLNYKKRNISLETDDEKYLSSDNASNASLNNFKNFTNTEKNKNKLYPQIDDENVETFSVNIKNDEFFNEIKLKKNSQILLKDKFLSEKNENFDNIVNKFENCHLFDSKNDEKKFENESDFCKYLSNLDIKILKKKLKEKNFSIGPINTWNRKLYEKRLAKVEINQIFEKPKKKYSYVLEKMFLNETKDISFIGKKEEEQICNAFSQAFPKNEITFFCYLLIDPTMLPNCVENCTLKEFVDAIFYVGKGKRSRPLQHLIDASQCRKKTITMSTKLQRISNIWDQGNGVISLQLSQNIHSDEAFIREKCMIEAIGIENLTNVVKGNKSCFKNLPSMWSRKEMQECGALLIRKAHAIFCNERCRAITEADVDVIAQNLNFPTTKKKQN